MKIRALLGTLALCIVGADVCTGAITNVRVTGVTSTHVVIAYTARNLSACTVEVYDESGYRFAGLRVTAATNASPMAITTDAEHTLVTGDKVYVTEVGGNRNAKGFWATTVTGSRAFTLDTFVGNGAYTSPGSVALVVHDVNTRVFAGSDEDRRTGNLSQGRDRTAVIGARVATLALDGWRKVRWPRRAVSEIGACREEWRFANAERTVVIRDKEQTVWWTFAGARANGWLAPTFRLLTGLDTDSDNYAWRFTGRIRSLQFEEQLTRLVYAGGSSPRRSDRIAAGRSSYRSTSWKR